jgi:asparagine synthase (glutamine-hydrolysing)
MCGIAGMIGQTSEVPLHTILEQQNARGPDFRALERIDPQVLFGHNRLSILDLSAASHQPMWDSSQRFCISYNGEIYNYLELKRELQGLGHVFRTTGDTEVLLEAWKRWGTDALERLNGMFAFALFDKEAQKVYLVRDRFGVKPLFYAEKGNKFLFASSGKGIAQYFDLKPNLEYVAKGIQYWLFEDDTNLSQYHGLKALEGGCLLELDLNRPNSSQLHRYYHLEERAEQLAQRLLGYSDEALTQMVLQELTRAVSVRLRSDVPVGVSLSGGLDSSSITRVASELHGKVKGFTFGDPLDARSEGPLVAQLAQQTGIEAHYIGVDIGVGENPDWHKLLWDTLEAQDAPFASTSIMAQNVVYAEVKRQGIKVLLGGQGGDELFMGYRKFQMGFLLERVRQRDFVGALGFALTLLPSVLAELPRAKLYGQAARRYLGPKKSEPDTGLHFPRYDKPLLARTSSLRGRQIQDILVSSLPTLLRYEDRNSMSHSVESRLPFMDYRLAELALALPATLKLRGGYGKWVVRKALEGRIPESIRMARYKRGFDVSQNWLERGLGGAIRTGLLEREDVLKEYFDGDVEKVFSDSHLHEQRSRFTAAMSLLWLGGKRVRG